MLIERIRQAFVVDPRVPGGTGDLHIANGRIVESAAGETVGSALFVGGRVVVPALVDAHLHLDKAFLRAIAEEHGALPTDLPAAIAAVAALRARISLDVVHAHAERAVERLVRNGITAARVHVEIDPLVGLTLVHLHRALAAAMNDRIALQLVAFPQRGLELSGARELFAAAMAEGLDVVGGCPYVDSDPRGHLDQVFSLAERHGAPIDLHLDFSDDAGRSLLGLVIERTRAHAMSGRVTVGHVTTLAAMPPDVQARALGAIAEAGIAIVIVPATDLYLAGHGEPGTRSLAPWERAVDAGVRVAIGNNNIDNPFAPFGNGNLLQAAWLAGLVRRAVTPARRRALLEMVTVAPATILGMPMHGPVVGADAHLAVLDAGGADDIMLSAPAVLATLRAGKLVHRLWAPELQQA
ncbi:MAG TPA: amidohydrolase family protein [Polyangiaceae bacterium]